MTKQEIFDKVYRHLLTQNAKSLRPSVKDKAEMMCAYRSGDGKLSCAVGCLIPDEMYSQEIENGIPDAPIEGDLEPNIALNRVLVSLGVSTDAATRGLLKNLQRIHDSCEVDVWKDELHKAATKFNLSIPQFA